MPLSPTWLLSPSRVALPQQSPSLITHWVKERQSFLCVGRGRVSRFMLVCWRGDIHELAYFLGWGGEGRGVKKKVEGEICQTKTKCTWQNISHNPHTPHFSREVTPCPTSAWESTNRLEASQKICQLMDVPTPTHKHEP